MIEVVVLGDVTVDIAARLESYPPLGGDVQPLETVANLGGTSLNTAVMLARLGVETALVARVGPDMFGDYILAQMEKEGLSNRWMERDAVVLTGLVYAAVTPGGFRTLFGGAGANRNLDASLLAADDIERSRWLHITSYNVLAERSLSATLQTMELAHHAHVPVSLDVGQAPVRLAPAHVAAVADRADVLFPSDDGMESAYGGRIVARKLGAEGCAITHAGERFAVPGLRVSEVVDTTGAGDAFDAGFIAGRVRGLDLRCSALLGNACGAAAVAVLGAGNALPPRAVILRLLRESAPDGWQAEAQVILNSFSEED